MIDMGMRENDRVHFARVVRKRQISFIGFASPTLIQPAFEKQAVPVDLEQMLTTGHRLCRAMKVEPHLSSYDP